MDTECYPYVKEWGLVIRRDKTSTSPIQMTFAKHSKLLCSVFYSLSEVHSKSMCHQNLEQFRPGFYFPGYKCQSNNGVVSISHESSECEKDSDLVSISHCIGQNNRVPKGLSRETFHKIYI